MFNKKIAVIGFGDVGQQLTYNLKQNNIGREIVLYGNPDSGIDKIEGFREDILDGYDPLPLGTEFKVGLYKNRDPIDLEDTDIAIITAGLPSKKGQSRLDLAEINGPIISYWSHHLREKAGGTHKPKVLVVTNPSGGNTGVVYEITGFPRENIIGIGNGLDGKRLARKYAEMLGLTGHHMKINAYGDHSEHMILPLETAIINDMPIKDFLKGTERGDDISRLDEMAEEMTLASQRFYISKTGKSPKFGPAREIAKVAELIYRGPLDEKEGSIHTALYDLDGEFGGIKGVAGVPVMLGSNGVVEVVENPVLMEKYQEALKQCADRNNDVRDAALRNVPREFFPK